MPSRLVSPTGGGDKYNSDDNGNVTDCRPRDRKSDRVLSCLLHLLTGLPRT